MTILEAQAVIDRAFEAGYFARPVPADRNDGRFAERNFRMEQVRELLGVRGWIHDHVDIDRLTYCGESPLLRGLYYAQTYNRAAGYEVDERSESLFYWRCALWDKFVGDVDGRIVDWETAGEPARARTVGQSRPWTSGRRTRTRVARRVR